MRSSALALMALIGLAMPVSASMISATLSGNSTLTPTGTPGIFVEDFTGDGTDAILGAFTVTSESTVDFSSPPGIVILNGSFRETFSNGTVLGTSSGGGTANGMGMANITVQVLITGGSGAFAGATGQVTVSQTLTTTSATNLSVAGTYSGTLSTVPEPASFALLAPALVILFRRRRG